MAVSHESEHNIILSWNNIYISYPLKFKKNIWVFFGRCLCGFQNKAGSEIKLGRKHTETKNIIVS